VKTYAERTNGAPVRFEQTRPVFIPDDLSMLHGLTQGMVTLPTYLDWSGSNIYDLRRVNRVRSLYGVVIQQATCERDIEIYLDERILRREWRQLRLPPHIRKAWESAHPELSEC